MSSPETPAYEFGPFRLEARERRLLRDGRPVPLRAKVFETLLRLVERQGRLVEKKELLEAVWPDALVPTLVLHCQRDAVVPFSSGRELAGKIPGARFVPLDSDDHLVLEHEPAWPRFLEAVRSFLDEGD